MVRTRFAAGLQSLANIWAGLAFLRLGLVEPATDSKHPRLQQTFLIDREHLKCRGSLLAILDDRPGTRGTFHLVAYLVVPVAPVDQKA